MSVKTVLAQEWKAATKTTDYCENCEETKPVIDCAELGHVCKTCFVELMEDLVVE